MSFPQSRARVLSVSLAACALFLTGTAQAMNVQGDIATMTWTAANSPYTIVDSVTVPEGNTLTIDPGVDVLFDADVPFMVKGNLLAEGTETDSIRFMPGTADEWGGIKLLNAGSNRIAYARVTGGHADGETVIEQYGGGVMCFQIDTYVDIRHSVIEGNRAYDSAGMFVGGQSDATIVACTFDGNVSQVGGAGLVISYADSTVVDSCLFLRNSAWNMVVTDMSTPIIKHCVFTENQNGPEAVLVWNDASPTFDGCTFTDNSPSLSLKVRSDASATVTNSILWDGVSTLSNTTVTYSDVMLDGEDVYPGTGNINADPLFVDASGGNYSLVAASPCIDVGDPSSALDPDGTRADMGAYSYDQSTPSSGIAGTIETTTWTAENSPYRVVGTVTVPEENTLTIEPGVEVLFDADVQFLVHGNLIAEGTEQDSIWFLPGEASEWGGIRLTNGGTNSIAYTRISGGHAEGETFLEGYGGGIFCFNQGTYLDLRHSVISNNRAYDSAGMIVGGYSTANIVACTFEDNLSQVGGAGLVISYTYETVVDSCLLRRNSGWNMVVADDATPLITNTVFTENGSGPEAVLVWNNSNPTFDGCTIANNAPSRTVKVRSDAQATITNCILWGSTSDIANSTITYSNVMTEDGNPLPGTGNIEEDPLFVDADGGDFRLQSASPCIDTADPNAALDPDGSRKDMGAFAFDHGAPQFTESLVLPTLTASAGETVSLKLRGTLTEATSADLAIVFDSSALTPGEIVWDFLQEGHDNHDFIATVLDDTLFVSMYTLDPVTVEDSVLFEMEFVVSQDVIDGQSITLSWVPYPETNVNEREVELVDGVIHVGDFLLGDVSGDGTLSVYDASLILKYLVRLIETINLEAAEVTGNDFVSSADAAWIAQKVLDPSVVFPIESVSADRIATSAPILEWRESGDGWDLAIVNGSVLNSASVVFSVPAEAQIDIDGPSLMEVNRQGSALRVALVQASGSSVLIHVSGDALLVSAPTVTDAEVNGVTLDVLTSIAEPMAFALNQNAPNPFNPTTTISLSVPEAGEASLTVWNANGQLVRTLLDGGISAGTHEVTWNGRAQTGAQVASGVYMYRLTYRAAGAADSEVSIRRMTLVR